MICPSKLPQVRGQSSISTGFRITWDTINRLIDYCKSIETRPTIGMRVSRTSRGTTATPTAKQVDIEDITLESEGGDARWS